MSRKLAWIVMALGVLAYAGGGGDFRVAWVVRWAGMAMETACDGGGTVDPWGST